MFSEGFVDGSTALAKTSYTIIISWSAQAIVAGSEVSSPVGPYWPQASPTLLGSIEPVLSVGSTASSVDDLGSPWAIRSAFEYLD